MDRGLGRLHRVVLVVDRRGRARQIVDLVDLDVEREGHVVADELEVRVLQQVQDVALGASEQVVGADHLMPLRQQAVDQVRAEEAGAAGDKDPLLAVIEPRHVCTSSQSISADGPILARLNLQPWIQ